MDVNGETPPAAPLEREMTLLRRAVGSCVDDAFDPAAVEGLLAGVDGSHLLWLGRQHGVLLNLERALVRTVPGGGPPGFLAQLNAYRKAHLRMRLAHGRRLCRLQAHLDRAGVALTAVDGLLLAERYHRIPALRDADEPLRFLARPADRERAAAVLAELGYTSHPLQLVGPGGGRVFLGRPGGRWGAGGRNALGADEVLERSEAHRMGGVTFRIPSRTDWLLFFAVRFGRSRWLSLGAAFDLLMVVRARPDLDWPVVLAVARARGLEAALVEVLARGHDLLELPLPGSLASHPSVAAAGAPPGSRDQPAVVPAAGAAEGAARVRERLGSGPESRFRGRYTPTRDLVVERMLKVAGTGPGDVVYDLGCGDGRIVRAAASGFGARGVGVDLDPERIAEARAAAAGLGDRVRFVTADLFDVDLSDATVVCLYLEQFAHVEIGRRIVPRLRPGTRIVSHHGRFPEWPPEHAEIVVAGGARPAFVYLWKVGETTGPPDLPSGVAWRPGPVHAQPTPLVFRRRGS